MRRPFRAVPRRGVGASLLAGLACAGLIGLSGCATGQPGVVAQIGSERITETQVSTAVDGVAEAFGADSQISRQAVVDAMVRGVVASQIATENNLDITDADRDKKLAADESGAKLLTNPAAKTVGYDLADQELVAERLGADTYAKDLAASKVTLNPRYGTWNGGVVAESGSLSSPLASPSP